MVKQVTYPVKIHLPKCKCKHYNDKVTDNTQILVSPYIKEDFRNKYYIYNSMKDFELDKAMFIDNCMCTHSDGIYNGGVIIIAKDDTKLNTSDNNELEDLRFVKLSNIKDSPDNSKLINQFCKMIPSLLQWNTLIGNTISYNDDINYTFPKGKISLCDNTSEDCCYREFTEETNFTLEKNITDENYQLEKRRERHLRFIPLDIIIDNFLMKIIMI